jgi:Flp pilus assembly pilin Flp
MKAAQQMTLALTRFLLDEAGSSLIEFVLIGSLIATVCSLAVLAIGKDIC